MSVSFSRLYVRQFYCVGSRSVSCPLAVCTTNTRPCPFQDSKRRAFQGRGHDHLRPAAVFVQKLSSVTVVNTGLLISP
jgi:hypothetical protein